MTADQAKQALKEGKITQKNWKNKFFEAVEESVKHAKGESMIVSSDPIFLSVNLTAVELGYVAGLIVNDHNSLGDKADEPVFSLSYKIKEGLKARKWPKEVEELINIIIDDLSKITE